MEADRFAPILSDLLIVERRAYERYRHDYADTSRSSGTSHGRAVPTIPAPPFQPAASHRHGALDPLEGATAGQCAEFPCRLLLRATRFRSPHRERSDANID